MLYFSTWQSNRRNKKLFEWVLGYLIQISRFSLHWPIRVLRFNLIKEISAWKITDAMAAGYCFTAYFLAGPLLKSLSCDTRLTWLTYFRLQNSRFLFSKSVKKLVKCAVRVLRARSARTSHARGACETREKKQSLPRLAPCFQPRSRPFVWLLARTWIRKITDCFAVLYLLSTVFQIQRTRKISEMKRPTFHHSTFGLIFRNGDKQKRIENFE